MAREIYLNGAFTPFEGAHISPDDRGFQFSESVYEVIRAYGGKPLEMERHMRRLVASADYLGVNLQGKIGDITETSGELVRRAGLPDALIYIQVSTGAIPRSHLRPSGLEPTILITVGATPPVPPHWAEKGLSVITVPDERWARCYVKTTMLLVNTNAKKLAAQEGHDDAIFIRDGFVTEATAANIFAVIEGRLVTPPKSNYILHGITREIVMDIARELSIECEEAPIPQTSLYEADELILSGTAFEVAPITSVDGRILGSGKPGGMTARLADAFQRRTGSQ